MIRVVVILLLILDFNSGELLLKYNEFKTDDAGYSASAEEMRKLIEIEVQIVQSLSKFQDENYVELHYVTKYLNDFQNTLPKSVSSFSGYAGLSGTVVENPLNTYLYLRRFVYQLPRVKKEVIAQNITGLMQMFKTLEAQLPFPTQKNVEESIKSIIRLKYTYNISADELSAGNLGGFKTDTTLEAEHCYEIAFIAGQNNFWSIAIDFYEVSRKLAMRDGRTSLEDISRIDAVLESTIELHDELLSIGAEQGEWSPTFFQSPLKNRTSLEFQTRTEMVAQPALGDSKNRVGIEASYEGLCRGEDYRKPEETKLLKCYSLRENIHKYWLIRPIEIEYLSQNPPVVQIYNFLSSGEAQMIINFSKPELKRSRYINGAADSHRTSSSGFISDSDPRSLFYFINQRVETMTGLKVTSSSSSEDLQVTHYPPGGHYSHHYDSTFDNTEEVSPEVLEFGDRIASFMIYLSSVKLGGNTAFPVSGVSAFPVQNSALFWYNLHTNGSVDVRSLHGGCPVLYGTKWVANKWINANEQMFRRKCYSELKEEFHPFRS